MALAIIYTRANVGILAPLVTIEAHLSRGLPGLCMVGLPEAEVKESRYRVRSALLNSFFEFPARRITVNMAPADLRKEGGRFDLPIALGILAASGQIPKEKLNDYEFVGELALSGELRPIKGILPIVLGAQQAKRKLIVPHENANEAALLQQAEVFSAEHLLEVCAYLKGERSLKRCELLTLPLVNEVADLSDVQGQVVAKRALEVAAAGKHSLLLIGPPGTGKTMLAQRLPGILPDLTEQQALEIAAIASVSLNGFHVGEWRKLPFRNPHHSSSSIALVGGSRPPKPGEISLAHHGILFLDELPEFSRQVLESLREPLESGYVKISRAAYQTVFPAQFQLIAAMNPCPCGYVNSQQDRCRCTHEQVQRYFSKLSGPLLDRIDMHIEVASVSPALLLQETMDKGDPSVVVKARVNKARERQLTRQGKCNAELLVNELTHYCHLDPEPQQLLMTAMNRFTLSARVYHRLLRLARTIADLDEQEVITKKHISEVLSYRCLDRQVTD